MRRDSVCFSAPEHNIVNAGNIVGTHNARNRLAGSNGLELLRILRDDDICFIPRGIFQEICIPHPDHLLDGEAFQLHGILADILRRLVIGNDMECFRTGISFCYCYSLKFTPGTDTTTEAFACNPFRTTCRKQLYRYPKCTSLSYISGLSFRQTISAIRVSSSSPLQKMT